MTPLRVRGRQRAGTVAELPVLGRDKSDIALAPVGDSVVVGLNLLNREAQDDEQPLNPRGHAGGNRPLGRRQAEQAHRRLRYAIRLPR